MDSVNGRERNNCRVGPSAMVCCVIVREVRQRGLCVVGGGYVSVWSVER